MNKTKIKAVFFDIGGVLLTDPKYKEFWKDHPELNDLKELFGRGKLSIKEFVKEGAKAFKLPKKEFLENYKKAYYDVSRIDHMIKFFQNLKIEKYILSDSNPIHLLNIKKNFGAVLALAKKVYFSPETQTKKTDKETFELIIRETKVKPKEIVLVDNREDCLLEPRKQGIKTILFKNLNQLKKDFEKLGIK